MNDGSTCRDESDPKSTVESVLEERGELDSSADLDALIGALAKRRRRYLLYLLAEEPRRSTEDLAAGLVALEASANAEDVRDRSEDDVRVSLVHRDIPVLAEAGVVSVDEDADIVSPGRRFPDAMGLLEGAVRGTTEEASRTGVESGE